MADNIQQPTNFPFGVTSFGVPMVGSGTIPVTAGRYWFVNGLSGNDAADGHSLAQALQTISAAVARATASDVICVVPGSYDETVTIPRTVRALTIVGLGNLGDVGIAPSAAGARAMTFNNDDLTLINMDLAGDDTAAFTIFGTGSRFRAYGCKFEGANPTTGAVFGFGPGSVAQVAALTAGNSGDTKLFNCEFAWGHNGISFVASDYGVPTQVQIVNALFHNLDGTEMLGVPAAFGIGSVRNLECIDSVFDNAEDGTAPSDYVNLNTAFDSGIFTRNSFALATNAIGDIKIGAKIKWVANATEAGWSTARPA